MEKVQWNSIDKKQYGLKYSKNDKPSTIPQKELHNEPNPAPTIYPLPAKRKMVITIKIVHNP